MRKPFDPGFIAIAMAAYASPDGGVGQKQLRVMAAKVRR